MASRPQFGETRSQSYDTLRSPSPRVEHFDGEIPPALSPLDAFAAQGRLLARQLEQSKRGERRMSRLPPSSVARSLSQGRPGFFRGQSSGDSYYSQGGRVGELARRPTQKNNPEVEEPKFRPHSEHPRISAVSYLASEDGFGQDDEEATPTEVPTPLPREPDTFDVPRAESPDEDMSMGSAPEATPRFYASGPSSPASPVSSVGLAIAAPSRTSSTDSASRLNVPRGLAPPPSPLSRPSTSSRATQPESSDDDNSSSNAGSTFSKARKLSSCSAMSLPYSPMSANPRSHPRSPSMSSETSNTTGYLPRPSFNFSRPLSRSSTSLSAPVTIGGMDQSYQSGTMHREHKPSPIIVPTPSDLANHSHEEPSSAVSSYIYTKYSLPRGRKVSRNSVVFSGLQTPNFEWNEPLFESPPPAGTEARLRPSRTPSPPPSRHESVYSQSVYSQKAHSMCGTPTTAGPNPSTNEPGLHSREAEATSEPEVDQVEPPSAEKQKAVAPPPESTTSNKEDKEDTTSSADSASTIRPQTGRAASSSGMITADEHVAKGIECHEKGSLNESTYHLRIAAKQNHPTGMLLYALACRHGWGMRPNQREGVQWLRKAVDCVGLELMDDSNGTVPQRAKEMQKAYRAQFALSIYELGVSHLNGWGIEQDKSLALRCFEIAGQWGDADALAEAGFCYAEGIGCKKDMKKAAKFYRQAEAKGISMVGNSWIYKDKYKSDDESVPRSRGRGRQGGTPEKNARSKSRTRSLFHRKKSLAAEA
ncbi:protein DSF2 [Aspergillus udagawae]|uniref:Protein DSF2 n=1 Tax=Aspergillus udagawae TaxID=91492 RepID=A0ABQ1AIJ3_9EURO|nr:protein DSF2 [Aspergillus udagawae]